MVSIIEVYFNRLSVVSGRVLIYCYQELVILLLYMLYIMYSSSELLRVMRREGQCSGKKEKV